MVRSFLPKFSSKSERRLLALCKNNADDDPYTKRWNKNAVQYLLKKLKKNLEIVEELEKSIKQECSDTKCVLIPQILDNRLLVSHRRGLPQVIYCRLWRWPDLQSHHQIRAVSHCQSSVELTPDTVERPKQSRTICVNPYHYERKKPAPLEPVLVPCYRIPPDLSTSFEDSDPTAGTRAVPMSDQQNNQQQGEFWSPDETMPFQSSRDELERIINEPPRAELITPPGQPSLRALRQQPPPAAPPAPQQPQQEQPPPPAPPQYPTTQPHQQHYPQPLPPPQAQSQQQQQQQQQPQYQQQPPLQHCQHQHPQSQQYPQQYPHQQSQQQQYQQPQQIQLSVQQGGLRQAISTQTEVAHPYQFKQNKFAPLARAMHEHSPVGPSSSYDPNNYVTRPYNYHQSYQPQYSQPQPTGTSIYIPQQSQPMQYPTHPPSYTTSYTMEEQQQFPPQEQMQLDYQQEVPMAIGPQPSTYYEPLVAGTSQSTGPEHPIQIDLQAVPFVEGSTWCSISYHEYDQRIGDNYQPNSLTVSVDGYTHPMCSDRFCIGGLSNVNRNEFTEWVRRRIGKGVKLTYVDGEVYVECLCESNVFVSSPSILDEIGKETTIDRVTKVPHGSSIKVFSNPHFSGLLSTAVSKGFEAVYKLTNYCTFRVSFVKGWGRNYKRQTILQAPCWVEVQLNGPLQWIDKVLRQMKPPTGCGSTS